MPVALALLLEVPGVALVAGAAEHTVTGVTLDSRRVARGDLYAALPGAKVHGADFLAEVVAAGASALLTDPTGLDRALATGLPVLVADDPRRVLGELAARTYSRPAAAMVLIGTTGTNGKTTTSYLVEAGLRAAGHRTGLVGTVGTQIGDRVLPSARTTPEAPELAALLALMREEGVTAAAMEVSSHALAQGRMDGTPVDVAVFTNLSQDHLDFHGSMQEYFAAKALLFTRARAGSAVINLDDPMGERLLHATRLPVATVSASGDVRADWRAETVAQGAGSSDVVVHGPAGERLDLHVGLPGDFNVANALCALAALAAAGVDPEVAARGISGLAGVPGRAEPVHAGQEFTALVDYAHTPDAVTRLLATLRPLTPGRLVVVLGCGGDRDAGKRPLMGAAAVTGADLVILTSDNPRSEDPVAILDAMAAGAQGVEGADVEVVVDRRTALALAVQGLGAGDTLVVAGKGHEQGQEIGGVVLPFDDRVELARAVTFLTEHGIDDGGPA